MVVIYGRPWNTELIFMLCQAVDIHCDVWQAECLLIAGRGFINVESLAELMKLLDLVSVPE